MARSWTWTITDVPVKDRRYVPDGPLHPLFKLSCKDPKGVEWIADLFCTIEDLDALNHEMNRALLRVSEAGTYDR